MPSTEAAVQTLFPLPRVEAAIPGQRKSKKFKKRKAPPSAEEFVNVVPVQSKDDEAQPVQLSKVRRSKQAKLSAEHTAVTSTGGYRSVQTNKGVHVGTWFFEVEVATLGATGHCRLGIGTERQDVDGPCGYTEHSYGFRDVDGSKVHKALREPYSEGFKEGDVVGVYLHMPEGGRTMEAKTEIVLWKGRKYQTRDEPTKLAEPLVGSKLGFFVNGDWRGVAFADILEGTYYGAGSLFTAPNPETPACLKFNFGPHFRFPPRLPEGLPTPEPLCRVAELAVKAAAKSEQSEPQASVPEQTPQPSSSNPAVSTAGS